MLTATSRIVGKTKDTTSTTPATQDNNLYEDRQGVLSYMYLVSSIVYILLWYTLTEGITGWKNIYDQIKTWIKTKMTKDMVWQRILYRFWVWLLLKNAKIQYLWLWFLVWKELSFWTFSILKIGIKPLLFFGKPMAFLLKVIYWITVYPWISLISFFKKLEKGPTDRMKKIHQKTDQLIKDENFPTWFGNALRRRGKKKRKKPSSLPSSAMLCCMEKLCCFKRIRK